MLNQNYFCNRGIGEKFMAVYPVGLSAKEENQKNRAFA